MQMSYALDPTNLNGVSGNLVFIGTGNTDGVSWDCRRLTPNTILKQVAERLPQKL